MYHVPRTQHSIHTAGFNTGLLNSRLIRISTSVALLREAWSLNLEHPVYSPDEQSALHPSSSVVKLLSQQCVLQVALLEDNKLNMSTILRIISRKWLVIQKYDLFKSHSYLEDPCLLTF